MRYRSKARHLLLALLNPHQAASRVFLAKGTAVLNPIQETTPNSFTPEYYLLALEKERGRVIRFFTFSSPLRLIFLPLTIACAPLVLLRLYIMNEIVRSFVQESQLMENIAVRKNLCSENFSRQT